MRAKTEGRMLQKNKRGNESNKNKAGNYPLSRFTKCPTKRIEQTLNRTLARPLSLQPNSNEKRYHRNEKTKNTHPKITYNHINFFRGEIVELNSRSRVSIFAHVSSYNPWWEHKSSVWSPNNLSLSACVYVLFLFASFLHNLSIHRVEWERCK